MSGIDRRSFLRILGAAAVLPELVLAAPLKARARIAKPPAGIKGTLVQGQKGRVNLVSLRSGKIESIAVDIENGHSVTFDPARPELAAVVDLDEGKTAVVDLRRRSVVRVIVPEKGYWLAGHGCFSPDGKRFYLAETPQGFVKEGRVNVFDTATWTSVARFPSGYAQTHMILPVENGTVLAVGHYGTFPHTEMSVTHDGPLVYLDARSGKILRKVFPRNAQHGMCHMDKTSADELVVSTRSFRWKTSSQPRQRENHFPSPVVFLSAKRETTAEMMPAELADNMRFNFTVKVDEPNDRVLVGHLLGNRVSAWGLKDQKLKVVKDFGTEQPLGIECIPGTGFYLVTTTFRRGHVLEPKNLSTVYVYDFSRTDMGAGAHTGISTQEFLG